MYFRSIFALFFLMMFAACENDSLTEPAEATMHSSTAVLETRAAFPDLIPLPDGFKPEGIVAGSGTDFYVGSLGSGAIYRGDFRSGAGEIWFTPDAPRQAVGLDFDRRSQYLFVAGGGAGGAYVIDTRTGAEVASFQFNGAFVNDVIVTREAAYFTDSFIPQIYRVPLGSGGSLSTAAVETLPLSGDFQFSPGNFNANGIEATADGSALIIVNSTFGELYRVDPGTGEAIAIDLGGETVASGDGILLVGKTLYVVRNFLNEIAVVHLASDLSSGALVARITDDEFRIPTTVTRHGSSLYAVNARFDVAPPQSPATDISFSVVRVND